MRKRSLKGTALVLAGILTFSTPGLIAQIKVNGADELSYGIYANGVADEVQNEYIENKSNFILPKTYSSVEKGYVTSVKNQGSLGICWAYAACAAMESYALTHGYVKSPEDVDFSEYALAYLTYNDSSFTDELGGTTGDISTNKSMSYSFQNGGNDAMAFKSLSKWAGIVDQDKAPDAQGLGVFSLDLEANKYTYNKSDISYILTGQQYISMKDSEAVKAAIMNNGAVTVIYGAQNQFISDKYVYNSTIVGGNHSVAIVGWDDTISKSLFKNGATPPGDGAWLIKNSWGDYAGDGGYFWLSYYDAMASTGHAVAYEIAPADIYAHNYQYDGSTIFANITKQYTGYYNEGKKFANVFTVKGDKDQELRAVSFAIENSDIDYNIKIYKTADAVNGKINPVSGGTLLADVSGKTSHSGYYTVELPETVILHPQDNFSVVMEFQQVPRIEYSYADYKTEDSDGNILYRVINATDINQSYYGYGTNSWKDINEYDVYDDVNFCIKAFTNDVSDTLQASAITGISQNDLTSTCVTWKKVNGATNYALYRSTSITGNYTKVYDGTLCRYKDSDIKYGEQYCYYVIAYNSSIGISSGKKSSVKSVFTGIPDTSITSAVSTGDAIRITWKQINDASSYEILRSEDGINYSSLGIVGYNVDSYEDNSVIYNKEYTYAVRTIVKNNGTEYKSLKSTGVKCQKKLSAPKGVNVNLDTYNKAYIEWQNVENSSGYIVRRINYNTSYDVKDFYVESGLNYIDDLSSVTGGTITYYIYAYINENNLKKVGDYSVAGAYYKPDSPLGNLKYVNNNGKIVLSWDSYTNLSASYDSLRYDVYISDNINGPYTVKSVNTNTYDTDLNISDGKEYYVKVVASAWNKFYSVRRNMTAYQEVPLYVGSRSISFESPVIWNNSDKNIKRGSSGTYLCGDVLNNDSQVDYSYKWYVSAGETDTFTVINGADSSKYYPPSNSNGVKYYYCEVTASKNGTTVKSKTGYIKVTVTTDVSELNIGDISDQVYTGTAITPDVIIKDGTLILRKDSDYGLTYSDNTQSGIAHVTVRGMGYYTGEKVISFKIKNKSSSDNEGETSTTKEETTTKKPAETTTTKQTTVKLPSQATSSKFRINQSSALINNISASTSVSEFLSGINEKNYCKIRKNGKDVTTGYTGTGMQLCLYNNNKIIKIYNIVISGDTNGDGKSNITDLLAVKGNILGKSTLSGVYKNAADLNDDGKVNITDFIKIKAKILGKAG